MNQLHWWFVLNVVLIESDMKMPDVKLWDDLIWLSTWSMWHVIPYKFVTNIDLWLVDDGKMNLRWIKVCYTYWFETTWHHHAFNVLEWGYLCRILRYTTLIIRFSISFFAWFIEETKSSIITTTSTSSYVSTSSCC